MNLNIYAQSTAYTFDGAFFTYGTIDLATGVFTSMNFLPQGSSYYPATADNNEVDGQYAIMSDFGYPATYYLMHINFTTLAGDSIAPVGPLASGQVYIKGMAYNVTNDTWYVISGDDFGSAAYLYTLNIATGALTVVGQIQNANSPVGIAINCNGNAYIVNIVYGVTGTAVLNSLDLTTAAATAIGTDLGLSMASSFSQDMDFDPDNANLYWSGYWSDGFFSEGGSFRLIDVTTGTSTEISTFNQFETITGFNVNNICGTPATFQLSVDVGNGWNMVSVPGDNPDGQSIDNWWSGHTGNVYKFDPASGYNAITTTTPGEGYWMKQVGANTYNTGDEWPAGGIEIAPHNPISVSTGWNMFGGYENSVDVNNLTTTAGSITYPIYKYIPGSGYGTATTLEPGYGYWVKVTSDCEINIPNALAKGSGHEVKYFKDDWGKIILTDAAGNSYTLYGVNGQVDLNKYELPPAPPKGIFDIRFSSGRIAEDLNNSTKTIDLSGVTYPLTVSVENMDIKLQDETGKTINTKLMSGQAVTINDISLNKLQVLSGELTKPTDYKLEQNYPNPFNPSTKIKYSVPADGFVNIAVYNILGEKVADIVNSIQKSGSYDVNFNGSALASGMYIYRMESGNFVSVKKMLLLK